MKIKTKFQVDFRDTPFLRTSKLAQPEILNWRCEILLTRNKEAIEGKNVLDIASHNGWFSWACLRLGAKHVTGVEGRQHLVEYANQNLLRLGYTSQRFEFIQGDIFDYLPRVKPAAFDTVLCFGFLYHTIRQVEFMREMKRIQPQWFLLDTEVARVFKFKPSQQTPLGKRYWIRQAVRLMRFVELPKNIMQKVTPFTFRELESLSRLSSAGLIFLPEDHANEAATIDPVDIRAIPTKELVELLLKIHGFVPRQLAWHKSEISNRSVLEDYKQGNRVSYIARPVR
ncbi:MAG: class I SAM-dependent methyltransferase [Chloroflexi bacterium]|nr:class I SAM-dependent methyltransferase [Chloroflexota bacterium]